MAKKTKKNSTPKKNTEKKFSAKSRVVPKEKNPQGKKVKTVSAIKKIVPILSPAPAFFSPRFSNEPWRQSSIPTELPSHYGQSLVFAMVKDPLHLFTYWEIHPKHEEWALSQLGGNWYFVKSVLRVFDLTEGDQNFYDIELTGDIENWYLDVEPEHTYVLEIGLRHQDGRYIMLVRSNVVTMPRLGVSNVIDEKWMDIDFEKMYALSGGFSIGLGSEEIRAMLEQRLLEMFSSGSRATPTSSLPTLPAAVAPKSS